MKTLGGTAPNQYEQQGRAGIVELYQCEKCNAFVRFPRYNHCHRLLETKTGRCGEWAQAFCCLAASLNFEVRYCMDWTDHVWAEVWSDHQQKWVHCDSCESRFDTPLMYESGWKKKLTYIIAFSKEEVVDVTKKYTRKWDEVLKRRRANVSEEWLENTLKNVNDQINIFVTPERQAVLRERRELDRKSQFCDSLESDREVKREELGDRESGDTEWKKSRGEFHSKFKPENHRFISFKKGNKSGIRKKILQFSKKNEHLIKFNPWKGESASKLSFEERLDSLISLWNGEVMTDQIYDFLMKNLLSWDTKTVFPVLDLLRILLLKPNFQKYMIEKRIDWFPRIIEIWGDRNTLGKHTFTNSMMCMRLCCNLCHNVISREFIIKNASSVISQMSILLEIGSKSGLKNHYRLAMSSLFMNLSMLLYQNGELGSEIINSISKYLSRIDQDSSRKNMIISLGVISYSNERNRRLLKEKKGMVLDIIRKNGGCLEWVKELEIHMNSI